MIGPGRGAGSSGTIERYCSWDGYLELSRVFPLAQTVRGLLGMARVLGPRLLPRPAARGPRPWGGEVGYWALERG